MFGWVKRQRLGRAAQRRLLVALARAEEELIETHVQNALDVIEAVADELAIGRALELYLDALEPGEPRGSIIARRALARLEVEAGGRRRRVREDYEG
ncbi:MAG TPA: hypothetical protein VK939_12435 [Longimicrobiales bacterium]|nr:hypothetical protein [Longimicrobiales bacterium]